MFNHSISEALEKLVSSSLPSEHDASVLNCVPWGNLERWRSDLFYPLEQLADPYFSIIIQFNVNFVSQIA